MGITSPFFFLCVIHLVIFLKSASSIHLGSPNRITKEVDQEQFNSTDEEYYYNVAKLLAELSQRNHIVRKQEITHDSDSVQRTPLVSEELVLDYNHDESEGSSSWNSTMFAQMLVTQEDEDEVIRAKRSMVLYSPGRSMFCVPVLARTEQRVTPVDRGYHWDIRSFDRRRYRRSISSEGVDSLESMQTEDEEQVRVERGLPFYEPPPEHENGYVRPQYPQEICEGINTGYEKRKIRCPPDTKCGLRIRDPKSCSSVSTECALDPICLPSHVRCNCRNTHICAFKEVGCNEHGCDSVPVCLLIAIGNQVTQENDVEYAGTTKCKIMGSPKTDICQPGESCSAVLPHGATWEGASELSKHCPLEPRCLRKKDYRKCENPSCRLLKKTCVLAEDCDEDELDFRKRCIFTPRCLDFGYAGEEAETRRVDSYFKICRVEGNEKVALCLANEQCVRTVRPDDPCLKGHTCHCTKFEPGCHIKGSKSCKDMQCQRRCEYTGTAGCNQFVLGPCCKNKRDPYRLTCPAEPQCLKEELYAPYVYSSSSESAEGDSLSRSEVCAKPFVTGPCNDMSIRWFFHAKGGVCKPFIYGGCLGNENNFQSEVRCQQFCLA